MIIRSRDVYRIHSPVVVFCPFGFCTLIYARGRAMVLKKFWLESSRLHQSTVSNEPYFTCMNRESNRLSIFVFLAYNL